MTIEESEANFRTESAVESEVENKGNAFLIGGRHFLRDKVVDVSASLESVHV